MVERHEGMREKKDKSQDQQAEFFLQSRYLICKRCDTSSVDEEHKNFVLCEYSYGGYDESDSQC